MSDFAAMRQSMVEGQVRTNDVTDRRLVAAMRETPRERFLPAGRDALAYADATVEMAAGRALLRPRDFSKLVQFLEVGEGDRVLDLGCLYGYSAAVLAQLGASVVAVEEDSGLAAQARLRLADMANVLVTQGALRDGAAAEGPFDVIVVNGAVTQPSQAWLDQLADGGRLGVFERPRGAGKAVLYRRDGGMAGRRELFDAEAPLLPGFTPAPAFVF